VTVQDIMVTDVPVISDIDTVGDVIRLLGRRRLYGSAVVDLEQNLVGYFSLGRFLHSLLEGHSEETSMGRMDHLFPLLQQVASEEISNYMEEEFDSLEPSQSAEAALEILLRSKLEYVPVVKDNRLLGGVEKGRLLQVLLERGREEE